MRHGNRQPAAGHAGEEQARAESSTSTSDSRASNCSLLLRVNFGQACAPGIIAAQRGHHLAAVAHAQRRSVSGG